MFAAGNSSRFGGLLLLDPRPLCLQFVCALGRELDARLRTPPHLTTRESASLHFYCKLCKEWWI